MLNLFIASINAMQSYSEKERQEVVQAILDTQVQIEGGVCRMHGEIAEMKEMLATALENGRAL